VFKAYRLNWFWESVLILGVLSITWGVLGNLGVVPNLRCIVFFGQLFSMVILLEIILPRYRFFHAARQLKEEPGTVPRAKTMAEGLAEVLAEGPGMDPVIGRKKQYDKHEDTEPLDQAGIDRKFPHR